MSEKFIRKKPLSSSKKTSLALSTFGICGSLGIILIARWLFGSKVQNYRLNRQIGYMEELERQEIQSAAIDNVKINDRYNTVDVELK